MALKNILIVVSDIERSKKFYQSIFGLRVKRDFGDNVMLTEGLVLQEKGSWEELLGKPMEVGNAAELFFEEKEFDAFLQSVEGFPGINIVKDIRENAWGRKAILLQDPDGHLIEVAEALYNKNASEKTG